MFSTKYVMICPCLVLKELSKQALALSLNVSSKFRHYDIFEREMFAAGKAADFQLRCCCFAAYLTYLPIYLDVDDGSSCGERESWSVWKISDFFPT